MFLRNRKHKPIEKIHVTWPEVELSEAELEQYFQFLLSAPVFVNQIPFLFGPPIVPDRRGERATVH